MAWTLRVTISPVNSFEPVFLKVPMAAILSLRFPFPSPHHCGLYGDRPAGDERWRTPKGLDSTGETFLFRAECRLCRQGKKVVTTLLR
ncbi:hypothetical protein ACFQ4K_21340 [Tistrella bauzanensis]